MPLFKRPYKICVSRQLGGCGDMLMTTPVYRGLKEKYPGCHLTVMTTWSYAAGALPELLKHNPHIDAVVRVEPYEFAPSALRANKIEYRDVPNEHVPHCVQACDLFVELNVICSIVETREQSEPENVRSHRTDIWCDAAGVNPVDRRPVLVLTRDELKLAKDWLEANTIPGRRRIGLVLKAMAPIREWPQMDVFAQDLMDQGYSPLTIDPMRRLDGNIPALIGKRIRFVAAVMAQLDAVVSPDTGLLHLAGTVGTPVMGLFGSTDGALRMRHYPGRYTVSNKLVPCGPCWYRVPCLRNDDPRDDGLCMRKISRTLVMHELGEMLKEFEPYRTGSREAVSVC